MRTVIISHNNDPVYSFFEPIVKWAWYKFGWECVCYTHEGIDIGYRSATISQMVRLYAAIDHENDHYIMTSDIDMLPLSHYWNPKQDDTISCYGRDLTNWHFPICYIGMCAGMWKEVMRLNGYDIPESMKNDLDNMPKAKSDIWREWWQVDQDLITDRLLVYESKISRIDRGTNPMTGYPIGRIDRSAWDKSLQQPLRIDAHLLRPGYTDENWPRIMSLIKECLNPTVEEVESLENYRTEWIKSH